MSVDLVTALGRVAADSRSALGLGGAAILDVGQEASTVAAGDDDRLLSNSSLLAAIVALVPTLPTSEPTAIADKYQLWNNGGSIAFVAPA